MARNVHEEAKDVLSRLSHQQWDLVGFGVNDRLRKLAGLIGREDGNELHRHVVVSAIAALETFHRGTVIAIVNASPDYRLRGAELVKERKVAMKDAVQWLNSDSVTFGELVALTLSCSSVTDLIAPLDILLEISTKAALAEAIDPLDLRNGTESPDRLVADAGTLIANLEEAFRLRHIFAHEAAPTLSVDEATCRRLLAAVVNWVGAIDAVLWTTVHKDAPLTQTEMNQHAGRDLRGARTLLAGALRKTLAGERLEGRASWFRQNHFAWKRMLTDWQRNTYDTLMGTMWPGIGALDTAAAVRARTQQVEGWYQSQYG